MDRNTLAGLMVGAAAVQVAPDLAGFVRTAQINTNENLRMRMCMRARALER